MVAALALLAACTTSEGPSTVSAVSTGGTDTASPPLTVATTDQGGGDAGYRVGPLDVLDVTVFQVPDLSKTVTVSAGGQIALPLIGNVNAAGKTADTLQAEITARLKETYLQAPQVSVAVQQYNSQRITVEGAVKSPGVFPATGPMTLLQAIALAQGLDRVADPHGIIVFRNLEGERHAATFDLAAIRAGRADDPAVFGGDIIVVDESGSRTAMRAVRESIGIFGLFTPLL